MLQSVKITNDVEWTCPAKTIAIFAHNSEFSYRDEEMPSIVSKVSKQCKTVEDVCKMIKDGDLPSAIAGDGLRIDLAK